MPWRILLCAASIFITLGLGVPPTEAAGEQSTFDGITNAHLPEPLARTLSTNAAEDRALLEALTAFQTRAVADDTSALSQFVSAHPHSGWAASILANEGAINLHAGYFSRATADWEAAWHIGKYATDPRAAALVDGVVGHLAQLDASLGRFDALSALFTDVGDRKISGSATEGWQTAHETLTLRDKSPQHLLLCGPVALSSLMLKQGATHDQVRFVHTYRTKQDGTSLADVARLAEQAKFAYRLVFRKPGQPVPVPSVVHWKVGHYSSIVARSGDRFRLEDAMFPGDGIWVTLQAIDVEASGYFLASADAGKGVWRDVAADEASKVWGKGPTTGTRPGDAGDPPANPTGDPGSPCPLCAYNIAESSVSLTLSDTPVGYNPPIGPSTKVNITYSQREASQPQNFSFYNVSPKWTLSWLTYVTDDPTNPGATVSRYLAGGGAFYYAGYNSASGQFTAQDTDGSVLALVSQTPVTYQRRLQDGSVEVYAQSDGSSAYPRNVFLSQIIDPQGNALTLNYDSQQRLVSLTDAVGRQTTLSYGSTRPLLVTRITDPFGRSASLGYDGLGRLTSITDVIGLTSSFTYDANSLVNSMTTPYGTTTFAYTAPGASGPPRFVQITDPLGYNEREEWLEPAPIPDSDPTNTVPQGTPIPLTNRYLEYRNSFHWDKNAYVLAGCTPSGGCDYAKSRITHFNHVPPNTDIKGTSIESVKYPLENRIWYIYPGQTSSLYGGSYIKPIASARVLDDGTTQISQSIYDQGAYLKRTGTIDPVGRESYFAYPNHIDLSSISQSVGYGQQVYVAQFTYNSHHLPLVYTDAGGQTTLYAYTSFNKVASITNSLGQTTKYEYDQSANLTTITNPDGAVSSRFSYDNNNRIASYTDSEGWVATYAYDNADRLTRVGYPDGTYELYVYDKLDLASRTDRVGRTWKYTHDANGRLTAVTDPLGNSVIFSYNGVNAMTGMIDAKENASTWTYDVEGRLVSGTDAGAHVTNYSYEASTSRLQQVTDAIGQTKQFAYTHDNLISGINYLNSVNATPNVTIVYDTFFARPTSMTDGTGTTTYAYVPVGSLGAFQLQTETIPALGGNVANSYDALGRIVSRRVGQAGIENFQYDNIGRLSAHVSDLGSFELTYLGQTSQLMTRQLSGSSLSSTWRYLSNADDRRLSAINNNGLVNGQFTNFEFTSKPGNIISSISESSDNSPVYPPIISQSATYNKLDQLINLSGQERSFDADGNLISDGEHTFSWDAENRLVKILYASQPNKVVSFSYDGLGRRSVVERSTAGSPPQAIFDIWCGVNLCQTRSGTGSILREYLLEGEFVPDASPQAYYYGVDQLGSVRRVFANSAISPSNEFDPFGVPLQISSLTRFAYAGLLHSPDLGAYHATYRSYEPGAGRWISRDPLGALKLTSLHPGYPNLYEYVRSDVLGYADPLGLQGIPSPPQGIPGGPYTPMTGQRPGAYQGPPQPKGPRAMCQYVPNTENGGPPGTPNPYWKYYPPGGGEQKYDANGAPLPPGDLGHAQDELKAPPPPVPDEFVSPRVPEVPELPEIPPGIIPE